MKGLSLLLVGFALPASLLGCLSKLVPPSEPSQFSSEAKHAGGSGPSELATEESGTIDEGAITRTFGALETDIFKCHQAGRKRVGGLAGDVEIVLRIKQGGKLRDAYIAASTVGDRETEKCILALVTKATWPTPSDGEVERRRSLRLAAGTEPPAAAWGPGKVHESIAESRPVRIALDRCKLNGELNLTGYIVPTSGKRSSRGRDRDRSPADRSGRFLGLGVAATSSESAAKADCVVDALKSLALPSPAPSDVAKVSFSL